MPGLSPSFSSYLHHLLALGGAVAQSASWSAKAIIAFDTAATAAIRQAYFAQTGILIEFILTGTDSSDESAAQVQTLFNSRDSYIDILAMDVVWVGDYGEYLLPLDNHAELATALTQHNPQNVAAGLYKGQLVAIPQSAEYGLLYSRMDILNRYGYTAPPTTMDEMESMLAKIVPEERKANAAFSGLVNQVNLGEGLTCNVLEMLYAEDAGIILEPNRTLSSFDQSSLTGQRAISVAKRWRRWYNNQWFPAGLAEHTSLREWTRGNALFMRNWPFAATLTRNANVAWPWRLTPFPGRAATLGGWLWGANKYTRQPEVVKQALAFMASLNWQRTRALGEGTPPTITALYSDSQVCTTIPICDVAPLLHVARRPSSAAGVSYPQVSKEIYMHWYDIIRTPPSGRSVEYLLDSMNRNIARILNIDVLGSPTNVPSTHAAVAAFNAIAGIEIVVLAGVLGGLVFLRKTPVVQSTGLAFFVPVTLGLIMQLVMVFFLAGVPDTTACNVRYCIHGFGYTLAVVCVGVRLLGLWTNYLNPFVTQRHVTARAVLMALAPTLLATAVILLGLSASGLMAAGDIHLAKSRYIGCAPSTSASLTSAVWYIWLGIQLAATAWVAFKASTLSMAPAESRILSVCIANSVVVPVFLIPFADLDLVDQPTGYILRSLAIVFPITVFTCGYLLPTAWLAHRYSKNSAVAAGKDPVSRMHLAMSSTGSKSMSTVASGVHASGQMAAAAKASMGTGSELMTFHAGASVPPAAGAAHHPGQQPATTAGGAGEAGHVDIAKLIKSPFKEYSFGCNGIVSVRHSRGPRWLVHVVPWTLKQAFLLSKEQLFVLQSLSSQASISHGHCIPWSQVARLDAKPATDSTGPALNEFGVHLKTGEVYQVMVSGVEEKYKWIEAMHKLGTGSELAGAKSAESGHSPGEHA